MTGRGRGKIRRSVDVADRGGAGGPVDDVAGAELGSARDPVVGLESNTSAPAPLGAEPAVSARKLPYISASRSAKRPRMRRNTPGKH